MKKRTNAMVKKYAIITMLGITVSFFIGNSLNAQERKINISGFSEFTYEMAAGDVVDEEAAEVYDEFGLIKEYSEERNSLHFPGIGLVFSTDLYEEKLTFLTEINFRTKYSRLDLGLERAFMNYQINNAFNIQTGIFSTPIGYLNRKVRTHGFLSNSVRTRDMVNLQYGLILTRIYGIKFHGSFENDNGQAIKYEVAIGSGRGITPEQSPFEIDIYEDNESSMSLSGVLEFYLPFNDNELTIGLSGYTVPKYKSVFFEELGDEISLSDLDEFMAEEEGEEEDEEFNIELAEYKEWGFAPFIHFENPKFEFIAEYHYFITTGYENELEDITEAEGKEYNYQGFSAEFTYKTKLMKKRFKPYVRYDFIDLPENGGPYLGLHEANFELKRFALSDNSAIMFGVNWNILPFNHIKLEYNYVLTGPQPTHAILFQSAFVF